MSLMFQGAVDDGAIISDGLLARWILDGDLLDSVGSANGTLVGSGVTIGSDGLNMTGANGGARFGDQDWFYGEDKQWSYTSRIFLRSLDNQSRLLCKTADSACSANERELFSGIGPASADARLFIRIYSVITGSPWIQIRSLSSISALTNHIVAITYDGTIGSFATVSRFRFFVDGAEWSVELDVENSGPTDHISNAVSQVSLGTHVRGNGNICGNYYTDGRIWDSRVYGRVLTPAEAISITNGTG